MHELAKEISYKFECRKDALRQTQDGGVKVTFTIHPQEMPQALYGDSMGQRYIAVIVPIDENEQPKINPPADKVKSYAGQAKMMASDSTFLIYLNEIGMICKETFEAEKWIEEICGVNSCAQIIEGSEPGMEFKQLQASYLNWKNSPPLESYEA